MFFNGQRVSALVFSTCMAVFYGTVYADDVEPEIKVLSNRADLISGGDALVEIVWGGAAHSNVTPPGFLQSATQNYALGRS